MIKPMPELFSAPAFFPCTPCFFTDRTLSAALSATPNFSPTTRGFLVYFIHTRENAILIANLSNQKANI